MKVYDTRRRNLGKVNAERFNGHKRDLAKAVKRHESQINRWLAQDTRQRKNMGEQLARRVEEQLGLPRMWLDQDHNGEPGEKHGGARVAAGAQLPRHGARNLPMLGTLQTGLIMNASNAVHFVEWATGDDQAFVVHADSDEYLPRLRRHECLCIEPSRPLAAGNQVVVKLADDPQLYFYEIRIEGRDSYTFGCVNPPKSDEPLRTVRRAEVEWCYFVAAILDAQLARRIPGAFFV